jgi:hypothetical protein
VKVVEAIWERRNLGVDVTEVTLERADTNDEERVLSFLREKMERGRYLLVKTPEGNVAFLVKLQALGFIFLECQYNLSRQLRGYAPPQREEFLSLARQISPEPLDLGEVDDLCALIGDGMFTTDRVALDPLFGVKTANTRYQNWVRDIQKDASCVVARIKYREKAIGFFAISFDVQAEEAHSLLLGLFKPYQGSALGSMIVHMPLKFASEKNMKTIFAQVSSNNMTSLRSHVFWGFAIESASYVFRCHVDN